MIIGKIIIGSNVFILIIPCSILEEYTKDIAIKRANKQLIIKNLLALKLTIPLFQFKNTDVKQKTIIIIEEKLNGRTGKNSNIKRSTREKPLFKLKKKSAIIN